MYICHSNWHTAFSAATSTGTGAGHPHSFFPTHNQLRLLATFLLLQLFSSLALFRVHVLFSRSLQALTRICTTCSLPCPLADRTDRQRPASLLFNHLSSAAAHISTRDTRCQVWVCQIESQAESVYAIMASSKVLSRPALIVPVSKAC